jgi:hypothetical protein
MPGGPPQDSANAQPDGAKIATHDINQGEE